MLLITPILSQAQSQKARVPWSLLKTQSHQAKAKLPHYFKWYAFWPLKPSVNELPGLETLRLYFYEALVVEGNLRD